MCRCPVRPELRPPQGGSQPDSGSVALGMIQSRRVNPALRFLAVATRSWGDDNEIECKNDCHGGIWSFLSVCFQPLRRGAGGAGAGAEGGNGAAVMLQFHFLAAFVMPAASMARLALCERTEQSAFPGLNCSWATPICALFLAGGGNRLVSLNGGSTSIAYNFNRYLGMVADLASTRTRR